MQGLYITPETLFHKLAEKFKGNRTVSEDNIYEWCFDAEVNIICNVDDMILYTDVELNVDAFTRKAILPCNVHRVVNVYDSSENTLGYDILPPSYIKLKEPRETVMISYYGLAVDEDGKPYINSGHMAALETHCTSKILEPDALIGKYPYNVYKDIQQRASYQFQAIKQSWKNKDHNRSNEIDSIRFNMLPLAARRRLLHKYYE